MAYISDSPSPSSSSSSSAQLFFPRSAGDKLRALKKIGSGDDAWIALCLALDDCYSYEDGDATAASLLENLVAVKVMRRTEFSSQYKDLNQVSMDAARKNPNLTQFVVFKLLKENMRSSTICLNLPLVYEARLGHHRLSHSSWVSMEYISGCELSEIVNQRRCTIPAWLVSHIFIELMSALTWLHRKGVYHWDLHTGNVMLAPAAWEPRVVLIDFTRATLSHEGEWKDCQQLYQLILHVVKGRLMGDDEDEALKAELLHAVTRAVSDVQSCSTKTRMETIWEACEEIAVSIKRESQAELPEALKDKMEEDIISDDDLESLLQQGGMAVIPAPEKIDENYETEEDDDDDEMEVDYDEETEYEQDNE